jgi:hypothetical protein
LPDPKTRTVYARIVWAHLVPEPMNLTRKLSDGFFGDNDLNIILSKTQPLFFYKINWTILAFWGQH